jgi:hypothetical protein
VKGRLPTSSGIGGRVDGARLLDYCDALQSILVGGLQTSSCPPKLIETARVKQLKAEVGSAAASRHGVAASSSSGPLSSGPGKGTGVPALGSTLTHQSIDCAPSSTPKDADVLSWDSESIVDVSEEEQETEDSEAEASNVDEEAPSVLEDGPGSEEDEDEEESPSDRDYEDDGADWSTCGVPSTPPRMEREAFATPPKLQRPPRFDADEGDDDSDASDATSDSKPRRRAGGCSHPGSYCNESECY